MQQQVEPIQGQIKVIGNYRFNTADVLGKGSFGVVYKCTHIETQKELALKMMPRPQIQNQEDLNKEIAIMTKLKGPNIVRFHEVLGTTNNIYIVIDLCDSDLYKKIKQKYQKMFQEKEAIKIMSDVLSGFLELIENGIIHRDLKPANILIKNDVYKLADFGFARLVDDFTHQKFGTIIGTPMYMSPQLLQGSLYTTKSDIWSIGFIFYELLYGKSNNPLILAPWFGNSLVELSDNIRDQELTFPENIQVSEIVKDVLKRCLAKKEVDRITWLELFQHPVFSEKIEQVQNLEQRCNRLEKFIATNLRIQIALQNSSIEQLIKTLNLNEVLSAADLEKLFIKIDNNIQKLEVQYIFQQMKQNPEQKITIEELKAWLSKFEIPTQKVQRSNIENVCLHELKGIMNKFKQTLQLYFAKYNKNKDGKMTQNEFKLLMKRMDENQSDQKILESYTFIDKEDKGFITIEEFQQALDNLKR